MNTDKVTPDDNSAGELNKSKIIGGFLLKNNCSVYLVLSFSGLFPHFSCFILLLSPLGFNKHTYFIKNFMLVFFNDRISQFKNLTACNYNSIYIFNFRNKNLGTSVNLMIFIMRIKS